MIENILKLINSRNDGPKDEDKRFRPRKRREYNEEASRKYAIEYNIHHNGKAANVKYSVRWYGYTLAHDTIETLEGVPKCLITRK